MAITQMLPYVSCCQFTGANSAELVTLANDIALNIGGVGSSSALNGSSTGTLCIIDYKDPSSYVMFQTYTPLNDWLINDGGGSQQGGTAFVDAQYRTVTSILNNSRVVNNGVTRSVVTGTGATGFQISATKSVMASYSVSLSSTATIGGSSGVTVALESAPTNSATPSDWVELARVSNTQTITLAVALQSVQVVAANVKATIPAGWYVKLRSTITGTASATYASGQEVLI